MLYENFELRAKMPGEVETEIVFEITSRRIGGTELLRIDIPGTDDEKNDSRIVRALTKTLKAMKAKSAIQFFAFPENFESSGTESRFLMNKYPELFSNIPECGYSLSYVYIKI